jgi:hypothetical protein
VTIFTGGKSLRALRYHRDGFGELIRTSCDPNELSKVSEGWCPWCEQRLRVTDEPVGSPHYADSVEAAIGEEFDTSLLHCPCCTAMFEIPRGDLKQYAASLHDDFRDGYVPAACEHVVAQWKKDDKVMP